MKKISVTIIYILMLFNANSQKRVWDASGKKSSFNKETMSIVFSETTASSPIIPVKKDDESGILALLPTAVDVLFKLTTKALENRVKSYTGEYSKSKGYLAASNRKVPDFTFIRTVDGSTAISIKFQAIPAKDNFPAFVYAITEIELKKSIARSKGSSSLDYTIEIKPVFIVEGEKKVLEVSPIAISSIEFKKNDLAAHEYWTDLILLADNSLFAGVSVKIVETNPIKVRAEKILAAWNEHKDDVKTVINNYLPKPKEEKKEEDNTGNGGGGDGGDIPDSSEEEKKKQKEKDKSGGN